VQIYLILRVNDAQLQIKDASLTVDNVTVADGGQTAVSGVGNFCILAKKKKKKKKNKP
jgi:hypothetical protein